jgi:hypothetical protein
MPARIKADWIAGFALYLAGLPEPEIAKRLGVARESVARHAARNSWPAIRAQAKAAAVESVGSAQSTPAEASRLVASILRRTVLDVNKRLEAIEEHDPRRMNLKEMEQRERIASSVSRTVLQFAGLERDRRQSASVVDVASQVSQLPPCKPDDGSQDED